jgi:ribonuclease P protein component
VAQDESTPGIPVGRLKRRADFLRVAAARRKWAAPGLILQVSPQPESGSAFPVRVGFTASRKVGNAVMRNRARRRLRAIVAELVGRHAKPGHDLVLIARTATCTRPFEDLKGDLLQSLKRTKAAQ